MKMMKFEKLIFALYCVVFSTTAFAGPTFESVTFGKLSTHCDEKNDSRSIMLDGRGVIVGFNWMQAGVSKNARFPDRVRCDPHR